MWNSGDIQFLALWMRKSGQRKPYFEICIDFFGYFYSMWTRNHDNTVKRQDGIVIRDEKVASLRDFLLIKPTDETFTIPSYKGDYHLSFGKRSLLGGIELRWRFLHSQEEWGHAHQLPRKERKDVLKKFKQKEQRQQLWFDDTQIKKLSYYLDGLLSLQD